MQALRRENKEVLWASMIKDTMKRKKPSFNESYYGYRSFTDLLEDAERKNIIKPQEGPALGHLHRHRLRQRARKTPASTPAIVTSEPAPELRAGSTPVSGRHPLQTRRPPGARPGARGTGAGPSPRRGSGRARGPRRFFSTTKRSASVPGRGIAGEDAGEGHAARPEGVERLVGEGSSSTATAARPAVHQILNRLTQKSRL